MGGLDLDCPATRLCGTRILSLSPRNPASLYRPNRVRFGGWRRAILRLCDALGIALRLALARPESFPPDGPLETVLAYRAHRVGLGLHVVFLHRPSGPHFLRRYAGLVGGFPSRPDGSAYLRLALLFQPASLYFAMCIALQAASAGADGRIGAFHRMDGFACGRPAHGRRARPAGVALWPQLPPSCPIIFRARMDASGRHAERPSPLHPDRLQTTGSLAGLHFPFGCFGRNSRSYSRASL